jgi:FkbM family methyltransferase
MKMATETHLSKLEAILSEPIASAKEREGQTFERRLAECRGRVVLFGVGSLGKTALQCLRSIGVEPAAFSDSNQERWDDTVEGVRVLSPKDAADKHGDSALFIVTIWSKGHRYAETKDKLSRLGCRKVVPSSSLRWKFADILMPYFCQDLPHRVLQDSERVLSAVSLWSDDQSREEYLRQVEWRASGDFEVLSEPDREESYFPSTLFDLKRDEFFVDCGSYTGDTLQNFLLRTESKFTGIVAVEPDPRNFSNLRSWTDGLDPQVRNRIQLNRVAVGAKRGQVRFAADGSEGSSVRNDGDIVVECCPLDDLLAGSRPTYIKMDIEGAEPDALAGAQRTIGQHRPVLSICVYHTQYHLWSIPLLVHELAPDYRLFLRPHDADGWDSVCYAIPEERSKIKESNR